MSYFQDQLDKLGTQMKKWNSSGTEAGWMYVMGDIRLPLKEVTVSKVMMDEEMAQMSEIYLEDKRDLIFDAALLKGYVPKPGHLVETPTHMFQVCALNQDQCFRYTSSTHKRIRVHTQIIKP